MLSPKRVKHRKQQKGRMTGRSIRGSTLNFGDFALQASSPGYLTSRQIEAARIAISRYTKKGGQMWVTVFPDKPITRKPLEVRMGSGKGNVEYWVFVARPGRILYELSGIPRDQALEALKNASYKLPIKTKVLERSKVA